MAFGSRSSHPKSRELGIWARGDERTYRCQRFSFSIRDIVELFAINDNAVTKLEEIINEPRSNHSKSFWKEY
jgi:hypothetical protein